MEAFYASKRTYFNRYVSFLVLLGTLLTYTVYSFIPLEFTGRSPESNTSSISPGELHNSSLYADGCYIIRSKQTNKALQAMSDNTVQQQVANGQSNQIWKQEAVGAQYRFTSQAGNKDQVMQVNSAGAGEQIRLGSYTGDFKQKWDMQDGGSGYIQVGLANNNITWDLRNYGNDPELQLYGTAGAPFNDYRLFSFESVSCPGTQNPSDGTTCSVTSPGSSFDFARCDAVGGWALDHADYSKTLRVDIYVDNNLVASVPANQNRPDLGNAFGNSAASPHGFTYTIPSNASWKDGNSHNISARICGVNGDINGSPKAVTCSGGTTTPNLSVNNVNGLSNASSSASTGGFTVNSNVNWTVSNDSGGWLTINPGSGSNTNNVSVSIAANGGATRSAIITVSGGGLSQTVQVSQQGVQNPATCATPTSPAGSFDFANCSGVGGWALDQSDYSKTLKVNIYVDGNLYTTVDANNNRPDLGNYFGNSAASPHGFSYNFPADASWKNGSPHNITVRICGINNNLGGSQSVTCSGGGTNPNTLSVNSSGLSNVSVNGGNGTISVNSNISWTVSGVPNWATVSPASGNNNGTVNVSIQSNSGATRSATLTVSGGGLTQNVQINQQGTGTPPWPTFVGDWPAQDLVFLENSQIQVGFRKSVGGCISIIKSKTGLRGGANLINDNKIYQNGQVLKSDKGRQIQYSSYAYPSPYVEAGVSSSIGWNGVPGGTEESIGADASPVLQYFKYNDPSKGDVIYTKTQPYQWKIPVLTKSYTEQWTWLEGNVVRTHARFTMFRDDQYRFNQEGRTQEIPCVYTIYPLNNYYYYQGNNPYSGGGLSVFQFPVQSGEGHQDIVTSEPWIASVDNNNVGIGLHVPGKSKFTSKIFYNPNESTSGDENTKNSAYIAYTGIEVLDNSATSNGVFDYDADIIVGSLNDIRGWVYQQQQPTFKPNYTFQNSRQGFFYHAASDQGWPISSELNISFGGYINGGQQYPELKSPYSMWKADQVSKIYVRAAVTGYSQLALNFTKPGPVLEPDINQQSVRFSVTPDGQYRTYEINVSQNPNWNGIISHFRIQLPYPYPTPSGNERLRVQWISADPNGPSNQSSSSFTASEARIGVAENEAEMQIRVLGNPVADQLRFEVTGAEGKKLQVKVLNTTGRVVESREIGSAAPVEVQSIDLGREQRGLLLLQVTTGNQSKTVKVIR